MMMMAPPTKLIAHLHAKRSTPAHNFDMYTQTSLSPHSSRVLPFSGGVLCALFPCTLFPRHGYCEVEQCVTVWIGPPRRRYQYLIRCLSGLSRAQPTLPPPCNWTLVTTEDTLAKRRSTHLLCVGVCVAGDASNGHSSIIAPELP